MLETARAVLWKIWRMIETAYRIFYEIDVEQRAASFAYYALFSMIPLATLFITVGSLFLNSADIIREIQRFVPLDGETLNMLQSMVRKLEQIRGGVSIVSILILMWSSLRFFQALVRGVNRAWHSIEIPWWEMPLKNLAMIAVIASGLLLGILIPAMIQAFRNAILALDSFLTFHFPDFSQLHLASIFGALDILRYLIGGVVLFYALSMMYMLAPRRRVDFRQIWMSALLVTLLLQICQIAFIHYVPRFVNYNAIYGTFGGIMLLLFWIYISGLVILCGACLCAAQTMVFGGERPIAASHPPSAAAATPSNRED